MILFQEFLNQHSWFLPALSKTLKNSKSLKSFSLIHNKKIEWIKTKNLEKKKLSRIQECLIQGFSVLWEKSLQKYFGNFYEIELEGGENRFFFNNIISSLWMASVSSNIETNFQHFQDFLFNSLDTQINLEELGEDQFLAIITSEGFNLWLKSKLPDFVLEDALSASLTAIERLQLELNIGKINESSLFTYNNKNLQIIMNSSNELAITKYDNDVNYDFLINKFFTDIKRSSSIINVPDQIIDFLKNKSTKIGNPLIEEMRATPIESEISSDEIDSLINFDESLLDRMEKTITTLAVSYKIREFSIPYLGKILKLPSVVIQLSLSYLIGQGKFNKANLKFSTPNLLFPDILELDPFSPSELEKKQIDEITEEFNILMIDIREFLNFLEEFQRVKPTSNVFNETEAIRQNTDSYPLITLSRDISTAIISLKERISLIEKKEDKELSKLQEKVKSELNSLKTKINNLKKDILSFYSFLYRFLPFPDTILMDRYENKVKLEFKCAYSECEKDSIVIHSQNIEAWRKYLLFLNEKKQTSSTKEFIKPLLPQLNLLNSEIIKQNLVEMNWNVDSLIITSEEREVLIQESNKDNRNSGVNEFQCEICEFWYCPDHFNEEEFKCIIHQKLLN